MSTTIVRYELDPTRLDEHLGLIDAVFEGLASINSPGIHYEVCRSSEGMHFTHIATFDSPDDQQAFGSNQAFHAFTADIADRCVVPPAPVEQIPLHRVG